MERILVELYDREPLVNIISLFGGVYDRVVCLCPASRMEESQGARAALARFVERRFGLEIKFVGIPEGTVETIVDRLAHVTAGAGEYHVDVTGGSPVFITALGIFAGTWDRPLFIHRYDTAAGRLQFRYPKDGPAMEEYPVISLSLEELIGLNGAAIAPQDGAIRPDPAEDDGGKIIRTLWETVRTDLRSWNNFCTLPHYEGPRGDRRAKLVEPNRLEGCRSLARRLVDEGFLGDLNERREDNKTVLTYRLAVPEGFHALFDKGGTVLELSVYLTAASGVFRDCCTGVALDWEAGVQKSRFDLSNEVDFLGIRGHIPVFASCKGSAPQNEHLYEIMTIARHFGGVFARPMVITGARAGDALRDRAAELGVLLLDDVCAMDWDGLTARWRDLFPDNNNETSVRL